LVNNSMNTSRTSQPRVKIVGHRGARGIAPENTLASFQKAIDIGVDAVEFDLHVSKDGKLVVMHDPNIERTTDGTGEIGDFSSEELGRLNAAAKFVGEIAYGVQRIPTLQQVLDLIDGKVGIYLEIKLRSNNTRYPGIEQMMLDVVRKYNVLASTLVSSFDFATLDEVKRLEPTLRTQVNISVGYFESLENKEPKAVAADLVKRGFRWIAINKKFLTLEMFSALKDQGLNVHPWAVNDVDEMWQFIDMGVDLITTDRPDLLVPAYRNGRKG
jgi:glycerophosphoryl diester phosphodiesterase